MGMDEKIMKRITKEALVILLFATVQIILFLLHFNLLFTLLFIPVYVIVSKEKFVLRVVLSYVIAGILLVFIGKRPVDFVYLLIVYIIPVGIYISLQYLKTHILDFSLLTTSFLLYQVLVIKAFKVLYKIDIVNDLVLMLKKMFEGYFKAVSEDIVLEKFAEFIKLIIPGFVIVESITFATGAYYIIKWISKRLKINKEFLNFETLFMPREVTIGTVVFFVLLFFLNRINLLYVVVSNMVIILSWLLFIQSLSLIYAAISDRVFSKVLRSWIMVIAIIFSLQFFVVMVFVGFLDLIFDFKKRGPKKVKV